MLLSEANFGTDHNTKHGRIIWLGRDPPKRSSVFARHIENSYLRISSLVNEEVLTQVSPPFLSRPHDCKEEFTLHNHIEFILEYV
jgi:hypothetical protein